MTTQATWKSIAASFASWVDAFHRYRQAKRKRTPRTASVELCVYALSSGASLARLLAQLDRTAERDTSSDRTSEHVTIAVMIGLAHGTSRIVAMIGTIAIRQQRPPHTCAKRCSAHHYGRAKCGSLSCSSSR